MLINIALLCYIITTFKSFRFVYFQSKDHTDYTDRDYKDTDYTDTDYTEYTDNTGTYYTDTGYTANENNIKLSWVSAHKSKAWISRKWLRW